MAITKERPVPSSGVWAEVAGPHTTVAVVGTPPLVDRLVPHVRVIELGHRDHVSLDPVAAVVLQASAFAPGAGGWAYALQPSGFDRTAGLRRILDEARERGLPVGLLDDWSGPHRSPWLAELAAAVDRTAKVLPAAGVTETLARLPITRWQPPPLVSAALLRLAGTGGGEPLVLSTVAHGRVADAQLRAAVAGSAVLDRPEDPWVALLAAELSVAGVPVAGPPGAEWTDDAATPSVDALFQWLGRDVPNPPFTTVLVTDAASSTEVAELAAVVGDAGTVRAVDDLADVVAGLGPAGQLVLPPADGSPLEPATLRVLIDLARWCPDAAALAIGAGDGAALLVGASLGRALPDDAARARVVAHRLAERGDRS